MISILISSHDEEDAGSDDSWFGIADSEEQVESSAPVVNRNKTLQSATNDSDDEEDAGPDDSWLGTADSEEQVESSAPVDNVNRNKTLHCIQSFAPMMPPLTSTIVMEQRAIQRIVDAVNLPTEIVKLVAGYAVYCGFMVYDDCLHSGSGDTCALGNALGTGYATHKTLHLDPGATQRLSPPKLADDPRNC